MTHDHPSNGAKVEELSEEIAHDLSTPQPNGSQECNTGEFDEHELKGIIEALLFMSQGPVSLEKLGAVLEGPAKAKVLGAARLLQHDYDQEDRGLRIVEVAGGFMIVTRPDCAPWVKRMQKTKAAPKISRSAIETLAIVAYKQPIVRGDIEHIRGVEAAGVLRTLLDQKLIRIVGRKDVPGRPILYGTSKEFLQRFGLRDLRDLPPLREFKDLADSQLPNHSFDEDSSFQSFDQLRVDASQQNGLSDQVSISADA